MLVTCPVILDMQEVHDELQSFTVMTMLSTATMGTCSGDGSEQTDGQFVVVGFGPRRFTRLGVLLDKQKRGEVEAIRAKQRGAGWAAEAYRRCRNSSSEQSGGGRISSSDASNLAAERWRASFVSTEGSWAIFRGSRELWMNRGMRGIVMVADVVCGDVDDSGKGMKLTGWAYLCMREKPRGAGLLPGRPRFSRF